MNTYTVYTFTPDLFGNFTLTKNKSHIEKAEAVAICNQKNHKKCVSSTIWLTVVDTEKGYENLLAWIEKFFDSHKEEYEARRARMNVFNEKWLAGKRFTGDVTKCF